MPDTNVAHIGGRPISGHDRPSRAFKPDRVCQEPNCGTRLSIYNNGQVLLPARAPCPSPHPRQEDRLSLEVRLALPGAAYSREHVAPLAAAKPWIYWLAPVLVLGAVLAVIAIFVGYLIKVVGAKYPRQQ